RDAADDFANIALFHMNTHRYDDAIRYARQAMYTGASLPSGSGGLRATSLSLIGNSLRAQGRLEEALQALSDARESAEKETYPTATERALRLYAILMREGRTLAQDGGPSLGRTEEAIQVYRRAVELTDEAASWNPRDQAS